MCATGEVEVVSDGGNATATGRLVHWGACFLRRIASTIPGGGGPRSRAVPKRTEACARPDPLAMPTAEPTCVWAAAHVGDVRWEMCTHNRTRDFRISADIQRHGCYECFAVKFMLRRLRQHSASLLDLGANIGMFTLAAAAGGYSATAYEPVGPNVDRIRASVHRNGFGERVRLVEAGLGAAPGWALRGRSHINQGGPGHEVLNLRPNGTFAPPRLDAYGRRQDQRDWSSRWDLSQVVPVVALDGQPPLPGPHLMKMDIQGAECAAMRGGAQFLRATNIVAVLMEWLDVDRTGPKRTCCAELESGLFRTLEEVHGLRPYALKAAARGGAPMNVSDICRRGKGPAGWDLLVWDRPGMDASTSGTG